MWGNLLSTHILMFTCLSLVLQSIMASFLLKTTLCELVSLWLIFWGFVVKFYCCLGWKYYKPNIKCHHQTTFKNYSRKFSRYFFLKNSYEIYSAYYLVYLKPFWIVHLSSSKYWHFNSLSLCNKICSENRILFNMEYGVFHLLHDAKDGLHPPLPP